tara:strand:- start:30 stop:398 length:369 start_codon:yes stop_codon:yes gene_type:complete
MAHFARIDKNNIVQHVCIIDNENLLNENKQEEEDFGIAYLNKIHGVGFTWVQTSYNGNLRKNYAGIGFTYDSERDAFIPPQTYDSWSLNEDTCQWEAPKAYPDDDKDYEWNEDNETWESSKP